jgi:hypothetical protein
VVSRIVNTMALAAAVVALATCLWQEWGLFTTLKRVILSYLGFFFLGSVLALIFKAVPLLDNSKNTPASPAGATSGKTK